MKKKYDRNRDYYADLGLNPTATNRDIGQAYRKLMLIWAPDKWGRREADVPETASSSILARNSLSDSSLSSDPRSSISSLVAEGATEAIPEPPADRVSPDESPRSEAKEELPASPALADVPHRDTKSSQPPSSSGIFSFGETPKSKAEAEAMTKLLVYAYEVLSDKETRAAYDRDRVPTSMSVDEHDWRKNNLETLPLPATEEEFLRCIEKDAKRHPHGNCFELIIEQSEVIKKSLWRLIESGWLFYEDLESAALDQLYSDPTTQQSKRFSYLCDTVLSRPDVVDHLVEELSHNKERLSNIYKGEVSPLIKQCMFFESGLIEPGERWEMAWLSSRPLEMAGLDQPLTDNEAFLCYLLKENNDDSRKVERWSPGNWNQGIEGRDSPVMGRHGINMLESLRTYMGENPPGISLKELALRLSAISSLVLEDGTKGLHGITVVQRRFYKPLTDKLDKLKQKKDEFSQEKIQRIEKLMREIEEVMLRTTSEWVRLSVEEPESFEKLKSLLNKEYSSGFSNLELPEVSFLKEISELYAAYQQEVGPEEEAELAKEKEIQAAAAALEAKRDTASKVDPPQPAPHKSGSQPGCFSRFFRAHPVAASTAGVSLLACFGIGGMACYERYLNGMDPFSWLQDSIGMGTPADMAVLLAAIVVVLLLAIGFVAQRVANNLNNDLQEPVRADGYVPLPA